VTSLNSLTPGQYGIIGTIRADEFLTKRLAALGFRIGKKVELIRRASFNGPVHVRIGTTDVILRSREAQLIQLNTPNQAQQ
jgi:ferrous iron transport protein A